MRKKFFIFLLIIPCLFLMGLTNVTNMNVYASAQPITALALSVTKGSSAALTYSDGYYTTFNTIAVPYEQHKIELTITTAPIAFESLTTLEQQQTIANIGWEIGGTQIVFSEGSFTSSNYSVALIGKDLLFTALLPGTYTIKAINSENTDINATVNFMAQYTTPISIDITTDDELNQSIEDFSDITLTAVPGPSAFLDPLVTYTYRWKINTRELQDKTSNTLVLTQTELNLIQQYEIEVEIRELTTISTTETINITTDENYVLTIGVSGELEQTLESGSIAPIQFTASLPVVETYTVSWFLKSPNSKSYKKIISQNNGYTFNTAEYTFGEYKIFAQTAFDGQTITSSTKTIILNSPPVSLTEISFVITTEEVANSKFPSLPAYKCKIEVSDSYNTEQFIWQIYGSNIATGTEFIFEPEVTGSQIIKVGVLDSSNNFVSVANSISLDIKTIQTTNYVLIFSISGAGFILLCALFIIVGNKMREKIW